MHLRSSFRQVPQRFPRLILDLDELKTSTLVAMRVLKRYPKSVCRYEKFMVVVTRCSSFFLICRAFSNFFVDLEHKFVTLLL